jgi:hypothetical protein
VWHLVWANFLTSERVKAHRYLRNTAISARYDLGSLAPSTHNRDYPLPFDNYRYDFT